MKLSGIDGVIVDWYGIDDFNDYATLNESTVKLFQYAKAAGLSFAICYEDATIKNMINGGFIKGEDARQRGHDTMQFAQDNWFKDDTYLHYNDQPLVFVFGPQYFRSPNDWETIFAGLDTTPALITLDGHMDWAALAGYPWPPMNMAGGAELAPAVLQSYLDLFYKNAQKHDFKVGGAFPGFHDIYKEAGVRSSYGFLDPKDGETLKSTIATALANNVNIIQLITWNDYGEGTMIEPTKETGYKYLEIIQDTRRTLDESNFSFTADDLQLPLALYNLRKAYASDQDVQTRLDDVFNAIVTGDLAGAKSIIDELSAS
jgi:hypothetical protein